MTTLFWLSRETRRAKREPKAQAVRRLRELRVRAERELRETEKQIKEITA